MHTRFLDRCITRKKDDETLDDLMPEFDKILFRDSYDLIWKTLTVSEKELVRLIVSSESGKVSEIKKAMKSPSSFSSLRARLINKHLVNTDERGYIKIQLPSFKEYVQLWHS